MFVAVESIQLPPALHKDVANTLTSQKIKILFLHARELPSNLLYLKISTVHYRFKIKIFNY